MLQVRDKFVKSSLQVRYKFVTSPLQVRYKFVTSLLQVRYKFVTSSLQVRYKSVTSPLQVRYKSVTSSLQVRYKFVTSPLQVSNKFVTSSLQVRTYKPLFCFRPPRLLYTRLFITFIWLAGPLYLVSEFFNSSEIFYSPYALACSNFVNMDSLYFKIVRSIRSFAPPGGTVLANIVILGIVFSLKPIGTETINS